MMEKKTLNYYMFEFRCSAVPCLVWIHALEGLRCSQLEQSPVSSPSVVPQSDVYRH